MQETSEEERVFEPDSTAPLPENARLDDLYTSRIYIRVGRSRVTGKWKLATCDVAGCRRKSSYLSGEVCRRSFIRWLEKLKAQLEEAGPSWERVAISEQAPFERQKRFRLKQRLTQIAEDAEGSL